MEGKKYQKLKHSQQKWRYSKKGGIRQKTKWRDSKIQGREKSKDEKQIGFQIGKDRQITMRFQSIEALIED